MAPSGASAATWGSGRPRWRPAQRSRGAAGLGGLDGPALGRLLGDRHRRQDPDLHRPGKRLVQQSAGGADSATQGRGGATLMWPTPVTSPSPSGYHIYLNDGSGTYRQVGTTIGSGAILWSSSGSAFYPKDSEIAALAIPSAATPSTGQRPPPTARAPWAT